MSSSLTSNYLTTKKIRDTLKAVKQDHIDRAFARVVSPPKDAEVVEVVSRLYRVISHAEALLTTAFAEAGLKHGEVDVLQALTIYGEAPQTPTAVASSLLCSSGAMTNRLDRLENAGLLRREHGKEDRRSILLSVTPEGRKAVKRASAAREAIGDKLVPGLTSAERKTLNGLLRKMLIAYEAN